MKDSLTSDYKPPYSPAEFDRLTGQVDQLLDGNHLHLVLDVLVNMLTRAASDGSISKESIVEAVGRAFDFYQSGGDLPPVGN